MQELTLRTFDRLTGLFLLLAVGAWALTVYLTWFVMPVLEFSLFGVLTLVGTALMWIVSVLLTIVVAVGVITR